MGPGIRCAYGTACTGGKQIRGGSLDGLHPSILFVLVRIISSRKSHILVVVFCISMCYDINNVVYQVVYNQEALK